MKQTGEQLKSARENKKLSLHEIGMSLKINPKTLQAIEEGDTSKLPQRTFLRGFVKSYAQFLKIDVKQTMDSFDQEIGISTPQSTVVTMPGSMSNSAMQDPPSRTATSEKSVASSVNSSVLPSSKLSERAPSHIDRSKEAQVQKMLLLLGGIFLAIFIVIIAKLVNKYQKERGAPHPKTEVARLQEGVLAPDQLPTLKEISPTEKSMATVETAVTPKLTTPLIEQLTAPAVLPPAPPKMPEVEVKPISTEVAATTSSSPPPSTEKKERVDKIAASAVNVDSPLDSSAPVEKPQEVIIEASGNVTINYRLDDGKTETVELSPEQVHTFKGKNSVTLEVSDGGAINLIVNGRDRGTPGKPGVAMKLRYPK